MDKLENIHGFPSDFIDPRLKEKPEWLLAVAKAIHTLELNGQGGITNAMRARWKKNLRFAEGNQSSMQYAADMGYKVDQEQGSGLAGYADIDFTPLGFMNKVIRVVEGTLTGAGHNFVLTAVDPTSQKEKKAYENALITKQRLGAYARERFNVDIIGNMYVPDDDETRMVYMKMGFKNAYEIAGERFLQIVYNENAYNFNTKPVNVRNIMACGFAVQKTCYDNNGKIKIQHCDPTRMMVGHSEKRDFSTSKYRAYEQHYTIAEIKSLYEYGNITEKDWMEIAKKYTKQFGNPTGLQFVNGDSCLCADGSYTYDRFTIPVWEIEYDTVDSFTRSKFENEAGENSDYRERAFNYKPSGVNKKKKRVDVNVARMYVCSWIKGSEFIYNYGPKRNMTRPKDKRGKPHSDFTMVKVSPADFHYARSFAHKMKPVENMLQNAWNKLQNAISKAKVDVTVYQGKALLNAIGMGIKGIDTIDQMLDAANGEGDIIVNSTDDFDNPNAGQPVQHITRGIGQALQEYIALIQFLNNMVRDITGVPVIADASAPDPRFGKKIGEMILDRSSKALTELVESHEYLLTAGAEVTLKKIQRLLEEKPDVYEDALGAASMDVLRYAEGLTTREMGIKVENRMTDEDIKLLYAELKEIVVSKTKSGKNDFNVYHYLTLRLDEMIKEQPKFAKYWLGMELEKIAKQEREIEKENIALNAQAQQQSNQVTSQGKMQELEMKLSGELKKIVVQSNTEFKNELQLMLTEIREQLKADLILQRQEASLQPATP